MSIHTRKEFAELCGVSQSYLNNYIARGKVLLTGNKVDDTVAENREFMESRDGKKPKVKAAEVAPVELDPDQKEEIKSLSLAQKKENLRKTTAEADKKELEAAKLRGESIPVELVMNIVSQLSQSFITSYRDMTEGFLLDAAHEAKLSQKAISKLRGQIIEGINEAMETGVSIARKDLKKIAAEYAVKTKRN